MRETTADKRIQVYAPGGTWVYSVPEDEARYLIRSGQAERLKPAQNAIKLREFQLPHWMHGGTRYCRKVYGKKCWWYELTRISREDAHVFGAAGKSSFALAEESRQRLAILCALLRRWGYDVPEG